MPGGGRQCPGTFALPQRGRPMTTHKVALVTGSGKKRLGWHIAHALAERGYALGLHYHHSVQEAQDSAAALQARGTPVLALQADVAEEGAVYRMVQQVVSQLGRIDV